jgi:macrolide-specific efflux system membrane fusion protein
MSKKKKSKGGYGFLVVVLLFVGGAYTVFFGDKASIIESQPLLVTIEIGSIENTIAAAGSLKPSNYVDVGAQVSGQLQRLYVDIGDYVEEGALLAKIDARVQEARVNASRASIEALEAQLSAREAALKLARLNVQRQERLRESDVTSEFEFDTALNQVAASESSLFQLQKQIEQSEASLETDETQLEFTRIYAPMSGTVVAIDMEEGRTLNAVQMAPTILRIADLGTMTVEAEISEADIGDIKAGMNVYFTTLGGRQRRWFSKVRQILPTPVVENNVVLYTGLFDIENQDAALLPEMTAQVYFVTASAQDVLIVPMGALTFLDRAAPGRRGAGLASESIGGQVGRQGQYQVNQSPTALGDPSEAVARRPGVNAGYAQRMNSPTQGGRAARPAQVTLVSVDGSQREQKVLVGVNSRISAEVLEGLKAGDKVIAGVLQNGRAAAAGGRSGGGFGSPTRRLGQ